MKLMLSCEHAFPDIPEKYNYLFKNEPRVLETHEGYDPGAYDIFKALEPLADFSQYQSVGRLLVEPNRSLHHPKLFSRFTKNLDKAEKEEILETFYFSYRNKIIEKIRQFTEEGDEVLHLSIHTFTPVLNNITRNCDIGLLYDPSRKLEKEYCSRLKNIMLEQHPELKVRYNYPYRGTADGFTTVLRQYFPNNYSGIEVEINQKIAGNKNAAPGFNKIFKKAIEKSLTIDF